LIKTPEERLGATLDGEIRDHHFFSGLDWAALQSQTISPPFTPSGVCRESLDDFEELGNTTNEAQKVFLERNQQLFEDFNN
jgi:hypothetical protein